MQQQEPRRVDYLFAGAGAAASLLLLSLERRGLLQGKRVAVLDPDDKKRDDKTFCFWCNPDDPMAQNLQSLTRTRWSHVRVNRQPAQKLTPLAYWHISGLSLYNAARDLMQQRQIVREPAAVNKVSPSPEGGLVVSTDRGNWIAAQVFDSRPPQFLQPAANETHLLQSFIGRVVAPENPYPDPDCFELMDFQIPQQGYTQFMYVLPFSDDTMLVELTRFGKNPISEAEAEPLLDQYIRDRFGETRLVSEERGCIPMSSAPLAAERMPGLVRLGGRAGAIKPSTGYGFKNMFRHAETVADNLAADTPAPTLAPGPPRFRFYDRLLLLILLHRPEWGSRIFKVLFSRNHPVAVLRFLDEQTSLAQDLRILLRLPLQPFLQAWWTDARIRFKSLLRPLLVLLVALALWAVYEAQPIIYDALQIPLLAIGLFLVGIPHGAVDHLLESGQIRAPIRLGFVLKYLGLGFLYLGLWLAAPAPALALFLLYSAWHFGQADMQEWRLHRPGKIKIFAWGALALTVILGAHAAESNQILKYLNAPLIPLDAAEAPWFVPLLLGFAAAWALLEKRADFALSVCLLAVGTRLPLLMAFGLYFVGQHSLNGWSHLKTGLQTTNLQLFLKALPFNLGAWLLLGALLYAMQTGYLQLADGQWIPAFFVFVSCISFPHVWVMHRFYGRRQAG
jgi:lycopene beta-cyclase